MNLFKERLLKMTKDILFCVSVVAVLWIFIWVTATFLSWLFGALIILMLLFGIGYFVNWLFIEPFRKRNRGGGK